MASTAPARIDVELFESARAAGALMSRSGAQQVSHWARLGRELEASEALSQRTIARVLAGETRYDDAPAVEQAVVRARWGERLDERLATLDLATKFSEQGRHYAELDDDGAVLEHPASS